MDATDKIATIEENFFQFTVRTFLLEAIPNHPLSSAMVLFYYP